jgi:hypothetical protein
VGDIPAELKRVAEERFVIGPVVDRDFWNGKRASMAIDRGPCKFNMFAIMNEYSILIPLYRGKPTGLPESDS